MKSIVLFTSILRLVLIASIISFAVYANAQNVAINTSGNSADASAMLDVSSSSKGFLPPRMTTIQRTGISTPANGLMVFDTDTKSFWYFATSWKEVDIAGGASFSLPYSGNSSAFFPFSITNTSAALGSSGIYGRNGNSGSGFIPQYSMGVWGDNSAGVGVAGTSNNIGVLGMTNGFDANGIGVKGINSSNYNAAVIGENSLAGGGVRGVFTGPANSTGYGVIGETGVNGNIGVAGKFVSNNPNDPTQTLWAWNKGLGNGFVVTMDNSQNNDDAIIVTHAGTGDLLDLSGQNSSKFSVSNNGNTITSGTVTVKGNKGIVRSSSATQLRIETPTVAFSGTMTLSSLQSVTLQVSFGVPFSSAPAVYVGNIISEGTASFMSTYIKNVTTTGCTLVIRNPTQGDFALVTSSWKLVAIGAE